ncbi:MAG: hypothetical protein DRJ67_05220 [Thermoprotei archaeon]|nr:MAG: hypothetical protein DRJ67_05220 [Thermoprotei archaeon]
MRVTVRRLGRERLAEIPGIRVEFIKGGGVVAAICYAWLWAHGVYTVLRRYDDLEEVEPGVLGEPIDDVRELRTLEEVTDYIAGDVLEFLRHAVVDTLVIEAHREAMDVAMRVAEEVKRVGT